MLQVQLYSFILYAKAKIMGKIQLQTKYDEENITLLCEELIV